MTSPVHFTNRPSDNDAACWLRPPSFRRLLLVVPLLLAVFGCRSTTPVRAQIAPLSVQMNLARLVDESENVVLARVTAVRAEPHPQYQNLNTVVVTLQVVEPLKGSPGSQLVFRQAGAGRTAAFRSSGSTYDRASSTARARAARSHAIAARGLAPSATAS